MQSGNVILGGNYIGTAPGGLTAAANADGGIFLEGDGATVGQGLHNIVSGNGGSQIHVSGNFNDVINNYIGLGGDGTTVIGGTTGVLVDSGAASNVIGGDSTTGVGNVIDGFTQNGVLLNAAGTGNAVAGNTIGADTTGTITGGEGIGIHVTNTDGTVVGDSATAGGIANSNKGNVIVGETGTRRFRHRHRRRRRLKRRPGSAGNFIGTNRSGTLTGVGNATGVEINGANSNTVGPGNDIAWNEGNGVSIINSKAVRIVANSIHDNGGASPGTSLGISVDSASQPVVPPSDRLLVERGTATVVGTIDEPTEPNTAFFIELFANGPSVRRDGRGREFMSASSASPQTATATLRTPRT